MRGLTKPIGRLLTLIFALASAVALGFATYKAITGTPIVGIFYEAWISAALTVLFFVGSVCLIILFLFYRNQPLSILAAEVHLEFQDVEGKIVVERRDHIIRANTFGVTAYHFEVSPTIGEVPNVSCEIIGERSKHITGEQFHKFGYADKGWHCIHEFKSCLSCFIFPFMLYPFFVKKDDGTIIGRPRKLIGDCWAVKARAITTFVEDFNRVPLFYMKTSRLQIKELCIVFHFKVYPRSIAAWRVRINSVESVNIVRTNEECVINVADMKEETLYITWTIPVSEGLSGAAAPQPEA